METHKLDEMQ